jgi:dihydroorotate dehydrogenase electron transfer subunit
MDCARISCISTEYSARSTLLSPERRTPAEGRAPETALWAPERKRGKTRYHRAVPGNSDAELIRHAPLGEGYHLLTFREPEVARQARGGQFVMMKAEPAASPPLRRPYSVMTVDPQEASFTLFVKTVGSQTRQITHLAVGEKARCLGPLGRPFEPPPPNHVALLVAGGFGVAPFCLFARELLARGAPAHLFYGGRRAVDIPLRAPFDVLGVPVTIATEDGGLGVHAKVTEPLERHLDGHRAPAVLYACGPQAMMRAVARIARERGIAAQVSLDPWMGCGLGTCLGCVVPIRRPGESQAKYRCACTEGPVFDAAHVVWPGDRESDHEALP